MEIGAHGNIDFCISDAKILYMFLFCKQSWIFFHGRVNKVPLSGVIMSLIFSLSNILIGTAAYCSG